MAKLTQEDKKRIKAYCKLFPKVVHVRAVPCEGTCTIRIKEFPNAVTQADDVADLIEMVSDCITTVLKIPKKYWDFMPQYLPSVELAQFIRSFPRPKVSKKAELSVVGGCQPAFA